MNNQKQDIQRNLEYNWNQHHSLKTELNQTNQSRDVRKRVPGEIWIQVQDFEGGTYLLRNDWVLITFSMVGLLFHQSIWSYLHILLLLFPILENYILQLEVL